MLVESGTETTIRRKDYGQETARIVTVCKRYLASFINPLGQWFNSTNV